jgi:hypothetical protein
VPQALQEVKIYVDVDMQTSWYAAEHPGHIPACSLLILLLLAWLLLKRQNVLLLGKGGQSSALQPTTQCHVPKFMARKPRHTHAAFGRALI